MNGVKGLVLAWILALVVPHEASARWLFTATMQPVTISDEQSGIELQLTSPFKHTEYRVGILAESKERHPSYQMLVQPPRGGRYGFTGTGLKRCETIAAGPDGEFWCGLETGIRISKRGHTRIIIEIPDQKLTRTVTAPDKRLYVYVTAGGSKRLPKLILAETISFADIVKKAKERKSSREELQELRFRKNPGYFRNVGADKPARAIQSVFTIASGTQSLSDSYGAYAVRVDTPTPIICGLHIMWPASSPKMTGVDTTGFEIEVIPPPGLTRVTKGKHTENIINLFDNGTPLTGYWATAVSNRPGPIVFLAKFPYTLLDAFAAAGVTQILVAVEIKEPAKLLRFSSSYFAFELAEIPRPDKTPPEQPQAPKAEDKKLRM